MTRRSVIDWTDENKRKLSQLWSEGLGTREIAAALSETCTKNAVIGMAHRMGLPPRPNPLRPKPEICLEVTPEKRARPSRRRPASVAPALVTMVERIPVNGLVALVDLGVRDCHFPVGDPHDADFGFCGALTPVDKVYCPEHAKLCYVPSGSGNSKRGWW